MTTQPRLLIRWAGADLGTLLDALGTAVDGGAIELPSARIEVDRAEPRPGEPRLLFEEVLESRGPAEGGAATFDVAAVGWATVELDRAAATLGARFGVAFEPAARDGLLGATARRSRGRSPGMLLLEPDTEGRLAGALARHGEGPIALYLRVPDPGAVVARIKARPGSGPLGPAWLVVGPNPAGPFLILVAGRPAPGGGNGVPSQR